MDFWYRPMRRAWQPPPHIRLFFLTYESKLLYFIVYIFYIEHIEQIRDMLCHLYCDIRFVNVGKL